jgi:hypothetical protein
MHLPHTKECIMNYTQFPNSTNSYALTQQMRYFNAAALSERAVTHHRSAARLHDSGDMEQARTHANIARRHTEAALLLCDECATPAPHQYD